MILVSFIRPKILPSQLFSALEEFGAVTLPFLTDEARRLLLAEALEYRFERVAAEVGPRRVKQNYLAVSQLPEDSNFWIARDYLKKWLDQMALNRRSDPFERPFHFNNIRLHLYPASPLGLGIHRDHSKFRNLLAIMVLKGNGRLVVCDDEHGANARYLHPTPGELVLIQAPGLFGADGRPYHALDQVESDRMACSLCCERLGE